ncbi:9039_t:CDS:1, partial [Racocetra fulgida]
VAPQRYTSAMSDVEDDVSVNFDIYIELKDEEQIDIVPGLTFPNWDQLNRYTKLYTRQNSFASIVVGSEYDDTIRRRCCYAYEHQ